MREAPVDVTTTAIVLAAGRGKRMGSPSVPKVLHTIRGRPMIAYVLDALHEAGFDGQRAAPPVVVVGFGGQQVQQAVAGRAAAFAWQSNQAGTGDAVRAGLETVDRRATRVLVVHGDEPLLEPETFRQMIAVQIRDAAAIVLLTGEVSKAHDLGRVLRDEEGRVRALVQQNELSPAERDIREINFGAYVFDRPFLEEELPKLRRHSTDEFYLTDLVEIAARQGRRQSHVSVPDPDRQMGINDPEQLARAERYVRERASRPANPQSNP